MGSVSRPCWLSQKSDFWSSSEIEYRRKKSAVTRAEVASSLTCLAPFSQYSCRCLWPGSGHAQPGQSKPLVWLTFSNVSAVRRTDVCFREYFTAFFTAGTPTAHVFGEGTDLGSSLGSSMVLMVCLFLLLGERARGTPNSELVAIFV